MPRDERDFYARLGRVVRDLRQARQLTQDQLAERMQLRRTSITNIEQGTQGVSSYSLVRLAEALGADPGEMLDAAAGTSETELEDFLSYAISDQPLQAWVRTIASAAASSSTPAGPRS